MVGLGLTGNARRRDRRRYQIERGNRTARRGSTVLLHLVLAAVERLRAANKPTIPSTIAEERETNPFLRAASRDLRAALGMADASDIDVFAETRMRKDSF